jgi:hypothetical protein
MSLPLPWVEKIFAKLVLVYGHDFLRRWDGLDLDQVKADWAHELSRFQQNADAIAWGLQHLPAGQPPTVIEFRALCNKRPEQTSIPLPAPVNKEVMAAALAKLGPIAAKPPSDAPDLAWAHRILERHRSGRTVRQATLTIAQDALKKAATA